MEINSKLNLTNVALRMQAPTPKFYKKLRSLGLIVGGIGAALLASPVTLPAIIVTIGGYLLTAGSVIAAVCQTTTENDDTKK